MKFKCACGTLVVEGDIVERPGQSRKRLELRGPLAGEIRRNHTYDIRKWTFVCPACQTRRDRA